MSVPPLDFFKVKGFSDISAIAGRAMTPQSHISPGRLRISYGRSPHLPDGGIALEMADTNTILKGYLDKKQALALIKLLTQALKDSSSDMPSVEDVEAAQQFVGAHGP